MIGFLSSSKQRASNADLGTTQDDHIRNLTAIRASAFWGAILIILFFVIFGYWATTAPISGAVIAHGEMITEGETQIVSHERGGVISHILVKEGDMVQKGQPLIMIEDMARLAELETIKLKIAHLFAKRVRLQAQEAGTILHSDMFAALAQYIDDEQAIQQLIQDQSNEAKLIQDALSQEQNTIEMQKKIILQNAEALTAELIGKASQRDLLKDQLTAKQQLAQKGIVSQLSLREAEGAYASADSAYRKLKAQIDNVPYRTSELDSKLAQTKARVKTEIAKEQSALNAEILATQETLAAAKRSLDRITLKSPATGIVQRMLVNTEGSAMAAFAPIVEIVPSSRPIVAEVKIQPADIDQIKLGQAAKLVFLSFDQTEIPPSAAKVSYISADRREDKSTNRSYYLARLSLDDAAIDGNSIQPGMPVEVYLTISSRTFASMMLEPFIKSVRRAFRS